ncbi:uncharacterized protein NPIL_665391 [Nephila pilipes]|uniref:Endoplasmic reticulum lectin 1 n=1 Tax=Nephila pilipes TaxID=299642 RepID=A0A8X6NJE8_NEPPI|nr:uncharacterized protein NPIL_665391 [Nephila pilipes]
MFSSTEEKGINCEEHSPMVLLDETFTCCLPSDQELLFKRNYTKPKSYVFTERVNNMPCLMKRQGDWAYVVCSHIIFQIHNLRYKRFSLGLRSTDHFITKKLQGFTEKGKQTYFIRHFKNGSVCGSFGEQIETYVRYVCRQCKEEAIFSVQQITQCRYEIHIYSPRVCSGLNFESFTGYSIKCCSKIDAMSLVMATAGQSPSANYGQYFRFETPKPKDIGGDIFFVYGANIRPIEPFSHNKAIFSFKKLEYRAEEIISASMGVQYDFSVDPQDKFEGNLFINLKDLANLEHSTQNRNSSFSDLSYLHKLVEKLMNNTYKKKKKKK